MCVSTAHSFNKYLWSIYDVPGTNLIEHRRLRKQRQKKGFCSQKAYSLLGEVSNQKIPCIVSQIERRGPRALRGLKAAWCGGWGEGGAAVCVVLSQHCSVAVLTANMREMLAGLCSQLCSLSSLCGITRFLSTQGRTAQGQTLLSADLISPTKRSQWKDWWMRRKRKWVLIAALPQTGGVTWYNALPLSGPPFPHLQK